MGEITANEAPWDGLPWTLFRPKEPHPPSPPCCQTRLLPSRQYYLRHRSRRAREPLHAASPPPAGASRSAYPVGRTWSASAATLHEYLSYDPLWRMLRRGTKGGQR